MNNGPSPINAGVAGTPLSNQAVGTRKKASQSIVPKPDSSAIRDTLETSDREADGRQIQSQLPDDDDVADGSNSLDLTG